MNVDTAWSIAHSSSLVTATRFRSS